MIRPVQDDERLAQSRRIARIEGRIPLFVLVAETHNDHIRIGDTLADANGIDHGALVIVPVLVVFRAQDRHAAVIAGRVIRDRAVETDVQPFGTLDDLFAPVRVNFTRQIDFQRHFSPLASEFRGYIPPFRAVT